MVLTTGDPGNPTIATIVKVRERKVTSSIDEEKDAMRLAKDWFAKNPATFVLISRDSQSLTSPLANNSTDTEQLRGRLDLPTSEVAIQWIPAHVGIPGNEWTYQVAKEATVMTKEPPKPNSMKCAKAWIKRNTRDASPTHHCTRLTYEHLSDKRNRDNIKNRKDTVLLARLRAGHCMKLATYKNFKDPTTYPTCPLCRENLKQ